MTKEQLEALCKYLNEDGAPAPEACEKSALYNMVLRHASHFRDPNGYKWEPYRDGIEKPMGPTICFKWNTISMTQDVGRHAKVSVSQLIKANMSDEDFLDAMNRLFLSNRIDQAANLLAE